MIIILIIIIVGSLAVFGILGLILLPLIISSENWAKKQAKSMLDEGKVDQTKVDRVLKVLSVGQDSEAKRLYNKLADLAEADK